MGCDQSKAAGGPPGKGSAPTQQGNRAAARSTPAKGNSVGPLKGGAVRFTHFNDGGRCEPLLMIMKYAGIPFENDIIKFEDWADLKPKTPMGTLPLMTVGSEQIITSLAMLTYLGGEAGLKGCDNSEQASAEAMVNMIEDVRSYVLEKRGYYLLGMLDEAGRLEAEQTLCEKYLPTLCKYLEDNITGDQWLLSKLTVADFWLYGTMKAISDTICKDVWSKMGKKVRCWKIEFESLPEIVEHLRKPDLTMKYFKGKGRIAPLDLIMAYGNRKCRRDYVLIANWAKMKPLTPMGYLPVLSVGDEQILTTVSMLHYLGSEMALRGSTNEEDAAVIALCNVIEDMRTALFPIRIKIVTGQLPEGDERKTQCDEFYTNHFSKLVDQLEKMITDEFLFSKLTMADFWFYGTMQMVVDAVLPDGWTKCGSKLQAWRKRFEGIKGVKEHLEKDGKPTMKLMYFDKVRGRVEPYRMMFAVGGINAEDETVTFDKWPAIKPTTAMGYLPILKVGEEEIHTSLAILTYISMEAGLRGAPGEEEAREELINCIEDARTALFPHRFNKRTGKYSEEEITQKSQEFIDGGLKALCDVLEKKATGDQWMLSHLCVVDFWLYGTMESIEDSLVPDLWSRMSPRLQKWKTEFEALPKIAEYLANRPKDYNL